MFDEMQYWFIRIKGETYIAFQCKECAKLIRQSDGRIKMLKLLLVEHHPDLKHDLEKAVIY